MQAKKTTKSTTKAKTPAKSTTSRTTAAKSLQNTTAPQKNVHDHPQGKRQFNAILLFAGAILLFFIALIEGKFIWMYFHNFLFGLFGVCFFFWPVLLTYLAIINTLDKPIASIRAKMIQSSALIIVISIIVDISISSSESYGEHLAMGYINGRDMSGGGFFGALFGYPLGSLLGNVGGIIILVIVAFVLIMLVFGLTLGSVWKGFTAPAKHVEQAASAHYQERYERKQEQPLKETTPKREKPYKPFYKKEKRRQPQYDYFNEELDNKRVIASNRFEGIDVPLGTSFGSFSATTTAKPKLGKRATKRNSQNNENTQSIPKNSYYESLVQPIEHKSSGATVVYSSIDEILSKKSAQATLDQASSFVPMERTLIEPFINGQKVFDISNFGDDNEINFKEEPLESSIDIPFDTFKVNKSVDVSEFNQGIGTAEALLQQLEDGNQLIELNGTAPIDVELLIKPEFVPTELPFDKAFDNKIATAVAIEETAQQPQNNAAQTPQPQGVLAQAVSKPIQPTNDILHVTPATPQSYRYPPTTLLNNIKKDKNEDIRDELKNNAERLVNTLKSFGVETRIIDISRGPAVTRYELQPSAGVKISKITSLADDIALGLASAGVRIEAPIPNKSAVGIEVPNKVISIVGIKEILESSQFTSSKSKLTVALGKDITGTATIADLGKFPHVLIAGATGSGKSICINSIIVSLLYKSSPDEVKLLMIDPKVVELGIYNGIPHLLVPVVTDPRKAAGALGWAVTEMLRRYKLFADSNVRDLAAYNKYAEKNNQDKVPQIVIIIDELADLMMAAPNEVEDSICRLAQMARAAGMHLVIATQRPSVDVITGIIKANIPSRVAFAVSSAVDSRTILDSGGAEKLMGRGDMLFYPVGTSKPVRVQGCYVSDSEVEAIVEHVKEKAEVVYDDFVMEEIEKQAVPEKQAKNAGNSGGNNGADDEMINDAIQVVVDAGAASTSLLQRRLRLGYARAARIIDQMEERGIVGPYEGAKPRAVLLSKAAWQEMQTRME